MIIKYSKEEIAKHPMNHTYDVSLALVQKYKDRIRIGAEVGVCTGAHSQYILHECGDSIKEWFAIDCWLGHENAEYLEAVARLVTCPQKVHILRDFSHRAIKFIPDGYLDFVFIDAGHDQTSVFTDILAWWNKVAPGGIISGHDYCADHPGVMQAVDAFAKFTNLMVRTERSVWWVLKPERMWWQCIPGQEAAIQAADEPQRRPEEPSPVANPRPEPPVVPAVVKNADLKIQTAKTRFAVLTQPRSGFTCLKAILDGSGTIWLEQNLFGKDRAELFSNGMDRFAKPIEYLEDFYEAHRFRKEQALGFRYNSWDQPDRLVEDYLVKMKDLKVVTIHRENITKGMVCCAFAHATNTWHCPANTEYKVPDIEIDLNWAEGWLNGVKAKTDSQRTALLSSGLPVLELTYESLFRMKSVKSLCEFLSVPFIGPFRCPLGKMTGPNVYKHILNRSELEKRFAAKFGPLDDD